MRGAAHGAERVLDLALGAAASDPSGTQSALAEPG